jgi:fumarylacetoacetase
MNERIMLNKTHDLALGSWVESAKDHALFPIQNLPFGIFSTADEAPRVGVAIGDAIVDLAALARAGLIDASLVAATERPNLNALMQLGSGARKQLRERLSALLSDRSAVTHVTGALYPMADCTMHLPAEIGDYTDFYAGIHHARAVGKIFRPDDEPLMPNYTHLPIGYHGRSSSIVPSGTLVKRPSGQLSGKEGPVFAPSAKLDFELEMAIWIGATNDRGTPVPIHTAHDAVWGYGLLNDWSARDIQAWEYRPLGPFLAKNFVTTVSPWVTTPEALAPFRRAAFTRDAKPMGYLFDEADQVAGGLDIELEVSLSTDKSRAQKLPDFVLSVSHSRYLYWTAAQLVAHHTSGGCPLRAGDLFGTGTISGPATHESGSLLELSTDARFPIELPGGETRTYLQDGDEITLRGICKKDGFASIALGECRGRVD